LSLTAAAIDIGERVPWPDPVLRTAVKMLVGRTRRRLQTRDLSGERDFACGTAEYPIAINTREANDQHYECRWNFSLSC
jgi:cyclopropane-fatty-acyl-phospholipid synthase